MLTRYMGTVYLPALEAIASCGYNSVWDQDTRTDFPITRSLTDNNNPSREVHKWPNIAFGRCITYLYLNIILVRCMVYYHTEDEWEQTMEVILVDEKGVLIPSVPWGVG